MHTRQFALVRRVAFVVVLFLVGFLVSTGSGTRTRMHPQSDHTQSSGSSGYVPSGQIVPGSQLEFVFVGASTCGQSNYPGLEEAVQALKVRLSDYARTRDMSFRALGIAVDPDADSGLDHLRRFGRFDEVSSGYGWGNALAIRYMWADSLVRPATPQVLIYTRVVGSPSDEASPLGVFHSEHSRELVAAVRGPNRIIAVATAQSLEEGLRIHNLIRRSDPRPVLRQ